MTPAGGVRRANPPPVRPRWPTSRPATGICPVCPAQDARPAWAIRWAAAVTPPNTRCTKRALLVHVSANSPATASRCWPTPWKMPFTSTPASWHMAASRANMRCGCGSRLHRCCILHVDRRTVVSHRAALGNAHRCGRTGAPVSTAESQEETHPGLSSNPVAPTVFITSLFCGFLLGFNLVQSQIEFSPSIA